MRILLLLSFCALLYSPVPSASEPEIVLHLVCTSGDGDSPQGKSSREFADRIFKASSGRIKVNVFYQNELGGQNELLDQLMKGNVHFMLEWPLTAYDQRLALGFLPYLVIGWDDAFTAFDRSGWLRGLIEPLFEENGLKFLGPYPEGFGGIGTRGRYATNFNDAQGIKVRSQTIFPLPQTMKAMGFEAVPIDWSEVYTSIQTGIVDGDSGNVIYWDYEYFGDVLDYFVHSKQNFAFSILSMNLATWDALDEDDQAIIANAAADMVARQFAAAKAEDEKWIRTAQENGMEYIVPSDAEIAAWVEKVRREIWPLAEEAYGSDIMNKIRQNASVPHD